MIPARFVQELLVQNLAEENEGGRLNPSQVRLSMMMIMTLIQNPMNLKSRLVKNPLSQESTMLQCVI